MSYCPDCAELLRYITDAKRACGSDRLTGQPLGDYIREIESAYARLRRRLWEKRKECLELKLERAARRCLWLPKRVAAYRRALGRLARVRGMVWAG